MVRREGGNERVSKGKVLSYLHPLNLDDFPKGRRRKAKKYIVDKIERSRARSGTSTLSSTAKILRLTTRLVGKFSL